MKLFKMHHQPVRSIEEFLPVVTREDDDGLLQGAYFLKDCPQLTHIPVHDEDP